MKTNDWEASTGVIYWVIRASCLETFLEDWSGDHFLGRFSRRNTYALYCSIADIGWQPHCLSQSLSFPKIADLCGFASCMGFAYNPEEVLYAQYELAQTIDNRQSIVIDFLKAKYRLWNYFCQLGVVVHAFNPSTEIEKSNLWESKASLVYLVRSCLQTNTNPDGRVKYRLFVCLELKSWRNSHWPEFLIPFLLQPREHLCPLILASFAAFVSLRRQASQSGNT